MQMIRHTDRPMTEEQIRRIAPSVFATSAHGSRSSRYAYIPTHDVISGLRREGFEVYFAQQARCRSTDKVNHTKHLLRLRHSDTIARGAYVGGEVNEIVLLNSHDGSSAYQLMAGVYRWVCANGMVTGGDVVDEVKVKHSGNVVDDVIDGAFRILSDFERVDASKDAMKALQLTSGEQTAFARAALALRFDGRDEAPITAEQVVQSRRYEDESDSLWHTFNRAQENLVRGGVRTADRRRRQRTRAVNGIDGNVALNRGLWVLAEEMRKLRGEAVAA